MAECQGNGVETKGLRSRGSTAKTSGLYTLKRLLNARRSGHATRYIGDRVSPIPLDPVEATESQVRAVLTGVQQNDRVVVGDAEGFVDEVGTRPDRFGEALKAARH